jgi:phosphoglycolate phosphatase-like HAD superfamily hydrolase
LDGEAAHAAGVPFIAYGNSELEADMHIESLREIQDMLGL